MLLRSLLLLPALALASALATAASAQTIVTPSDVAFARDVGPKDGTFDEILTQNSVIDNGFLEFRGAAEFDLQGRNGIDSITGVLPTLTSLVQDMRLTVYTGDDNGVELPNFAESGDDFDFTTTVGTDSYMFPISMFALERLGESSTLGLRLREVDSGLNNIVSLSGNLFQLELEERASQVIPLGTIPTIDGALAMGEWDDALQLSIGLDEMAAPVLLYLKHEGGRLYIAVDDQGNTSTTGDEIVIYFDDVAALPTPPGQIYDGVFSPCATSTEGEISFLEGTQAAQRLWEIGPNPCTLFTALTGDDGQSFSSASGNVVFEGFVDLVAGPLRSDPGESFGAFFSILDQEAPFLFTGATSDPDFRRVPFTFTAFELPEPPVASGGALALAILSTLRRRRA